MPGPTFSAPGELDVHYIPAESGAIDGARISENKRLAAAFAQADAPLFIREYFRETDVDGAFERIEVQTRFAVPSSHR